MSTAQRSVNVALAAKSYRIDIGPGLMVSAGKTLSEILPSKRICVVTDENVAKHYVMPLMKSLEAAGFVAGPPIILPAGEETKNFKNLLSIVDRCLSYKLDRKSTLIALGGGVVGDITGFAASMIMRGIGFVQIPTTLLAQVDSAVGGKTAINTEQGKNLVGSFYQPKHVIIDTDVLTTLPDRERKAGYAEILKYALIQDPQFFDWLEENAGPLLSGDTAALTHAIETSCAIKAEIVSADEKEERDLRALLNLGHTYGHALEALGGYDGRLLHGEAVSIGMLLAFTYAAAAGLCPAKDVERIKAHLEKAGLMIAPPFPASAKDIVKKMRDDKKNTDGKLTLVLARGIGQAFIEHDIQESAVQMCLENETWT